MCFDSSVSLSLVLMSKGCRVISVTLFKIGSEADVRL